MTNKRRMITATILLLTAFTALLNQTLMITALSQYSNLNRIIKARVTGALIFCYKTNP